MPPGPRCPWPVPAACPPPPTGTFNQAHSSLARRSHVSRRWAASHWTDTAFRIGPLCSSKCQMFPWTVDSQSTADRSSLVLRARMRPPASLRAHWERLGARARARARDHTPVSSRTHRTGTHRSAPTHPAHWPISTSEPARAGRRLHAQLRVADVHCSDACCRRGHWEGAGQDLLDWSATRFGYGVTRAWKWGSRNLEDASQSLGAESHSN